MKNQILIVDDCEQNRELLCLMLEEHYTVLEACDGNAAISLLEQYHNQIDIILLNILMPQTDGFGVLARMNEEHWIDRIPVIMISADISSSLMERAYSLGAADFISIPFDFNVVRHRVRNILRLYANQRQSEREQRWNYERKLDTLINMNPDIVGTFLLNLTQNICAGTVSESCGIVLPHQSGAIDCFVEDICSRILLEGRRKEFRDKFSREGLLQAYSEASGDISMRCSFLNDRDERELLVFTADIVQNPATGDIEAILYLKNITHQFIEETVSRFILDKGYDALGIIDLARDRFSMLTLHFGEIEPLISGNASFTEGRKRTAQLNISPEDRDKFLRNTTISNLYLRLQNQDSYSFHIRCIEDTGRKRFKKYSYYYLIREFDIVLATVEDITNEMERDDLTGQLNRRGFIDYAEVVIAENSDCTAYAILYIDVLDFKAVNEMLGVMGGDEVLRNISKRLQLSFLQPLAVARLSGSDHFLCLVRQDHLALGRLADLLHFTHQHNGRLVDIYMQCGIYRINNADISVSGMCDCAKLATKNIVDAYVQPYAYYSQALKEDYINKASVMTTLKRALANKEFKVFFQPIFDAKTRQIVSAEALIRWIAPGKGIIPPDSFIPILEENGFISQLDLYVAQAVQHFMEDRHSRDQFTVPVSVNLSGMDFNDKTMMDTLLENSQRSIRETLRFEITETCYVSMSRENNDLARELRQNGTKLLIDDFGSGYSSFSIIMDYEFDIIKLDMGFVRKIGSSPKSESIIQAIIDMAHHIDVKVIAEGAETQAQVDFLTEHGCDYIQGYYFSKPLPQDEFEQLLDRFGEKLKQEA